jgi:endonuclease YncB( thermonuclease family)
MTLTARVLGLALLLALTPSCAAPDVALESPSASPSPAPTATPLQTPEPFPAPTLDPASPWGLLIPPYEYEDGTTIIDGLTFIDGVVFDINGSDVFELCITKGYECVAYEDIIPIRLVHIDAPEAGSECYGDEAELELAGLLLEGMPVSIVTDPNLPEEDTDGILQAWVWNSEFLVNLEMVKRGAATPYFPNGTRGAFDQRLLNAARKAKAAGRGLWGACPGTPLNVNKPVDTGR